MRREWIVPILASTAITLAVVVWQNEWKGEDRVPVTTKKTEAAGCRTYYLDRVSPIDSKKYKQTLQSSECGKSGVMTMTDNHFLYFVVETSDGTKLTYKTTANEYKKWMENMKGEWQDGK